MNMPKLYINGFKKVLEMEVLDTYTERDTNNYPVELTVRQAPEGKRYLLRSGFQAYGWTTEAEKAFWFLHNVGLFTGSELYDIARGKKVA